MSRIFTSSEIIALSFGRFSSFSSVQEVGGTSIMFERKENTNALKFFNSFIFIKIYIFNGVLYASKHGFQFTFYIISFESII